MQNSKGVYKAVTLSGKTYFRASITYHGKHLSLGSYSSEDAANAAYIEASVIFNSPITKYNNPELELYDEFKNSKSCLSLDKWIMLKNFRNNGIYCRNPIYVLKKYFLYFLSPMEIIKFDAEDLFYYRSHKIMKRGGHLFVCEYGMQTTIFSRYGIKPYAVEGRDYIFINGDSLDYRYGNIEIINRYHGVSKVKKDDLYMYMSKIHVNGDIIIGRYASETEAAIAYNKAADLLIKRGIIKNFSENYIDELDEINYAKLYNTIRISKHIREYIPS